MKKEGPVKMMKATQTILLTLLFVGFSGHLYAQATSSIPSEYPSLYKGVRPVGMGNAFIAMPGSDENAQFYNPAAINDYEKKFHFRVLSPLFDFSPGSISLVKDVIDLADQIDGETTNAAKISDFRTFVDQHIGEFESVAVRMPLVQVQHQWFSVSTLLDSRTTISFRNRAFTNAEVLSRKDGGGVIGSAYNFKDLLGISQNLQAGLNLKVLYRYSLDQVISTDDILNNASFSDALPRQKGTGVGLDLGIKGDIPTFDVGWLDFLKPTAGFTWQDIGNTRFSGTAPDTLQSIGVGFALHPTVGDWVFHFANDFREMNQNVTFIKMWNVGAEVYPPYHWKYFTPSVRLGAHQGYIAAGTSLDFKYGKLEFSTYGEEAGKFSRQKQLRRLAANLSFGF